MMFPFALRTAVEEAAPYLRTVAEETGIAPTAPTFVRAPVSAFMDVVSDGTFYPTGPDSGMARYLNRPLPFDGNTRTPANEVLPEYDKLLQDAEPRRNGFDFSLSQSRDRRI